MTEETKLECLPTRGQPSMYSAELAHKICERVAAGEPMRSICSDPTIPNRITIQRWVVDNTQGFAELYARAKHLALDQMADDILEIADNPRVGVKREVRSDGLSREVYEDAVDRSRLQVLSRQWLLSRLAPKKYGDMSRMELTGADGGAIQLNDIERAAKVAALLAIAQQRKEEEQSDAIPLPTV